MRRFVVPLVFWHRPVFSDKNNKVETGVVSVLSCSVIHGGESILIFWSSRPDNRWSMFHAYFLLSCNRTVYSLSRDDISCNQSIDDYLTL